MHRPLLRCSSRLTSYGKKTREQRAQGLVTGLEAIWKTVPHSTITYEGRIILLLAVKLKKGHVSNPGHVQLLSISKSISNCISESTSDSN